MEDLLEVLSRILVSVVEREELGAFHSLDEYLDQGWRPLFLWDVSEE